MNFDEPEHIRLLRDMLEAFIARHMPREAARKWDREDTFPRAVLEQLAETGVMGLTIPADYGGTGPDILATMVTIEELSRRSLAIAVPYIMAACYAGMNIHASGTPEQKQEMLPKVAQGALLFAYGLTEPDVGADLASVRTRAEQRGERIVVNGRKRFTTGAAHADYIYTLVRTGPAEERYKNLSILLVPPTAKGVTLEPIEAIGLRGTGLYEVTFEDVELPLTAIVGGKEGWNKGWSQLAGPVLDVEKLEVAAMAVGLGRAALDDAWVYAHERQQFGKPIGAHQAVRHTLVEARVQVEAARLMVYRAAWLAGAGRPCGVESAMAKLYASEAVQAAILACQQRVMGAYGLVEGFDMERYARDILVFPVIGGSSAIQKNNIANRLGLPR
jgi:alkylation response protein AidB-like acyl-CoA dehydrogenase